MKQPFGQGPEIALRNSAARVPQGSLALLRGFHPQVSQFHVRILYIVFVYKMTHRVNEVNGKLSEGRFFNY